MADSPEQPDEAGVSERAQTRDDGGHGDHVIHFGRVLETEHESEAQERQRARVCQ